MYIICEERKEGSDGYKWQEARVERWQATNKGASSIQTTNYNKQSARRTTKTFKGDMASNERVSKYEEEKE